MSMKLDDSLRWQAESTDAQIASLRATLGDSVNDAAIDAMAALYRAGWNDCFKAAHYADIARSEGWQ